MLKLLLELKSNDIKLYNINGLNGKIILSQDALTYYEGPYYDELGTQEDNLDASPEIINSKVVNKMMEIVKAIENKN